MADRSENGSRDPTPPDVPRAERTPTSTGCAASARVQRYARGDCMFQGRRARAWACSSLLDGHGGDHPARRPGPHRADRTPGPGAVPWPRSRSSRGARRWSTATPTADVEALLVPPDQLRALIIAEADLGERLVRAMILRRVALIESGASGPVLIGPPDIGRRAAAAELPAPQRPPVPAWSTSTQDADAAALLEQYGEADAAGRPAPTARC